jgi:hypothetical protein
LDSHADTIMPFNVGTGERRGREEGKEELEGVVKRY